MFMHARFARCSRRHLSRPFRRRWFVLLALLPLAAPLQGAEPLPERTDSGEKVGKATPIAVPAQAAARFVDSIGVNVHAHGLYVKHHEAVRQKLGELGVLHVRDGAHPKACELAMGFHAAHGIKTTWVTGRRVGGAEEWKSPLNDRAIDAELKDIRERALAATTAIEGPNEYDLFSDKRDLDWPATLRRYQQLVFEKVKADPVLRDFPVVGPSLTSEEAYRKVGDLDAWTDYACVHHYQSTRHPGTPGWGANGYGSIDWTLKYLVARQSPSGKPVMSTECGQEPGGGDRISEAAEAKYLPRMFAEFFRRGYFRSFKYELLGNQWGLLRNDLSERPSFAAMKNLITLLRDPAAAAPGSLELSIHGAPADLRCVLLRKSDGSFWLLLWRETPSWDVERKRDLAPPPAAITLALAQPAARAVVFLPGRAQKAQQEFAAPRTLALSVDDELMLVQLEVAR